MSRSIRRSIKGSADSLSSSSDEEFQQASESERRIPRTSKGRSRHKRSGGRGGVSSLGFRAYKGSDWSRIIAFQVPKYLSTLRDVSTTLSQRGFHDVVFRMVLRSPISSDSSKYSKRLMFLRLKKERFSTMHCISKRFEWYSSLHEPLQQRVLTLTSIKRMIEDVFASPDQAAAAQKVFYRIDISNSGFVDYDDFVSYLTLSWKEICELAEEMLCSLLSKGSIQSAIKHAYRCIAKNCNGECFPGRIYVLEDLDYSLQEPLTTTF